MGLPDTVMKHDGRKVPFEAWRLEASVVRAAYRAEPAFVYESAARLGRQVASDVAQSALAEGTQVLATADIRTLATKALRSMKLDIVATAYVDYARSAAQLLWRVRVIEPAMQRVPGSGTPWDRRRLLESLREAGVGYDMAGWVAREVERRIVTLGQEYISPAMIHALAMLTLPADAYGARAYSVQRVAFSAAAHLPHWSERAAAEHPLPSAGAALEQFWLQGVHSSAVIKAVRDNLLSLDPYPSTLNLQSDDHALAPAEPCDMDFGNLLRHALTHDAAALNILADTDARITAIAQALIRLASFAPGAGMSGGELILFFKTPPEKLFDNAQRAAPITLNAGGLVAREGLRDPERASARLAELATVAARAHREREDYFLLSPVRGRILPIAVTGLWNAAAFILGDAFDAARASSAARRVVEQLCQALRTAVEALRAESGIELALTASAPPVAEQRLWRADREYFLRDGMRLNAAAAYEAGPELRITAAAEDFSSRLEFGKVLGEVFDEPPALTVEASFGADTDAGQWNELLRGLARAGIAQLRLDMGSGARSVSGMTRAVRSHLVGFPLLENLEEDVPEIVPAPK